MAEIVQRSKGRASNYKLDRGGVPAEFGPFTGIVMSTVDPARSGRLRVYIEAFSDGGTKNENDDSNDVLGFKSQSSNHWNDPQQKIIFVILFLMKKVSGTGRG